MPISRPAVSYSRLDLSSFLVIVPCGDHQEWHVHTSVRVLPENTKRVFEGLAAAAVHVAVQAPRSLGIVETRPSSTHNDFVRMVLPHPLVKVLQVLLAPLAAVCLPSPRPGMDPSVISV